MAEQIFTGDWTYRSFINTPVPVDGNADAALALIFGEGALTITEATPGGAFVATLGFGGDAIMDLVGTTSAPGDGPVVMHANGKGRPTSPIADLAYDYVFQSVPMWTAGIGQVQTLVGTVLRAADHGSAKKGVTASTVCVRAG